MRRSGFALEPVLHDEGVRSRRELAQILAGAGPEADFAEFGDAVGLVFLDLWAIQYEDASWAGAHWRGHRGLGPDELAWSRLQTHNVDREPGAALSGGVGFREDEDAEVDHGDQPEHHDRDPTRVFEQRWSRAFATGDQCGWVRRARHHGRGYRRRHRARASRPHAARSGEVARSLAWWLAAPSPTRSGASSWTDTGCWLRSAWARVGGSTSPTTCGSAVGSQSRCSNRASPTTPGSSGGSGPKRSSRRRCTTRTSWRCTTGAKTTAWRSWSSSCCEEGRCGRCSTRAPSSPRRRACRSGDRWQWPSSTRTPEGSFIETSSRRTCSSTSMASSGSATSGWRARSLRPPGPSR